MMLTRLALPIALSLAASACLEVGDATHPRLDGGSGGNGVDGGAWPDGGHPGGTGGNGAGGGSTGGTAGSTGGTAGSTGGAGGTSAIGGTGGGVCAACSTGTLVPPAPSGWSYALYAEKPPANTPCPDGYSAPEMLNDNLKDTGCGGCSCTASGTCNVRVKKYATTDCSGTVLSSALVSGCVDSGSGVLGVDFSAEPSGGGCTVSSQPKPVQYNAIQLCKAADPSCPCLATPASPFYGGTCLIADAPGDQVCPTGFSNKKTFGEGIDDTRDCTAGCSCGAFGCTASSSVECAQGCSSGCVGLGGFLGCMDATQPFGYGVTLASKCPASGYPQKSGTVVPHTTRTVCCKLGGP